MSPPSATWKCPVCGRRVPRRVAQCFCGARQEQAEQQTQREAALSGAGVPRDVAALLALMVLVGVYGIYRLTRDEPDTFSASARQALAITFATPDAPPEPTLPSGGPRRPRPAAGAPTEPTPTAPPLSASAPPPTAASAPAAAPSAAATEDPMAERRAAGLQAFEEELQRLSQQANRLRTHWSLYGSQCRGGPRAGASASNCDEMETVIRKLAADIEQGLDAAEDAARRAWLAPGSVRESRARTLFGTREWEEVLRAARDPRR